MATSNQRHVQGQPAKWLRTDRRWNASFQTSALGLPSWVTLASEHDLALSSGGKWYEGWHLPRGVQWGLSYWVSLVAA